MLKRLLFRLFFTLMIVCYRLSDGRIGGTWGGLPVLLLTTRGRKSGKMRTVPLIYFREGSDYFLIASNNGSSKHPGWYVNLRSNPTATLEVRNQQVQAQAEILQGAKREMLWQQAVQAGPDYQKYQQQAGERVIPVVLFHPAQPNAD
jgi:deazaflavin-dependent oxidoreductase (nitroreductase family)